MTTAVELLAVETPSPKRNWGGVVVAIAGAFELVATLFNAVARAIPGFPTNVFGIISGLLLGSYLLVPLALVVGFAPLAFGARGLASIAGSGIRGRLFVFAAALVSAIVQFALIFLVVASLGSDEGSSERAMSSSLVLQVFALLVGLIAGIVVARARVVRGYGRGSLIVAAILISITLALGYTDILQNWQDVPRAVGILALGVSYWRAGLHRVPSGPTRVTGNAKSLAE
ncbi:MAG TPA: hypothetical protein VHZ81_06645 [Galbitalea sp.]|jgi:hypothetical protein|nr:hypothetical protein [Galbitalea sp.]